MDTLTDDRNPEYPDPFPTESQVMAAVAKAEYDALPSSEKAAIDKRWAETPEWRKQDLRDEIEMDLL